MLCWIICCQLSTPSLYSPLPKSFPCIKGHECLLFYSHNFCQRGTMWGSPQWEALGWDVEGRREAYCSATNRKHMYGCPKTRCFPVPLASSFQSDSGIPRNPWSPFKDFNNHSDVVFLYIFVLSWLCSRNFQNLCDLWGLYGSDG